MVVKRPRSVYVLTRTGRMTGGTPERDVIIDVYKAGSYLEAYNYLADLAEANHAKLDPGPGNIALSLVLRNSYYTLSRHELR